MRKLFEIVKFNFKVIITFLVLIMALVSLFMFFYSLIKNDYDNYKNILALSEIYKNVINIVFFITAAAVGIFTYIQAKKSLFTPIKTEIFKLQLDNFRDILLFYQNKSNNDFYEDFDFEKILHYNTMFMSDKYVELFFKDKLKLKKEFKDKADDFAGAMIPSRLKDEYLELIEYDTSFSKNEKDEELIETPALKLAKWQKTEFLAVSFTKKFQDQERKISYFISSPLIPVNLRKLLIDFDELVHKNLEIVGETITEVAKEMPDKFPTAEKLQKFNIHWISNIFESKSHSLENKAKQILEFISAYLKIEKLI